MNIQRLSAPQPRHLTTFAPRASDTCGVFLRGMRAIVAPCLVFWFAVGIVPGAHGEEAKIQTLIIDGQNNHGDWPKITALMKQDLESTGRFTVDVERTRFTWNGDKHFPEYALHDKDYVAGKAQTDPEFKPEFAKYDVVISNFGFGAAPWPETTQAAFQEYVAAGGGLVVIHAADNSFGDWQAYNEMIGLGGWGGRNKASGPYVYWKEGQVVRDSITDGPGGSHGPQHEFSLVVRDASHPVTKGMPREWLHAKDELYDSLRGPAANMQVLATAFSPKNRAARTHDHDDSVSRRARLSYAHGACGLLGALCRIHHHTAARYRMGGHWKGDDSYPGELSRARKVGLRRITTWRTSDVHGNLVRLRHMW